MAIDWIKWHLDRIKRDAESNENPHERLGGIQHHIGELMKYYEDGTLVHKKNKKNKRTTHQS